MKVLILGLGYTGQELTNHLGFDDYEIIGTVTKPEADIGEDRPYPVESFRLESSEHIIHLLEKHGWLSGAPLSLVFTAGPPRREDPMESLELLEHFLESIPFDRLKNFVYLSSTSVYGDQGGDWVDEETERDPISQSGHLKVKSEDLIHSKLPGSIPAIILRPGGIYGPGRNSAERYLSEDYELVGEGEKWVNRIHVVDLARIIKLSIDIDQPEVLNAVDNNPVRLKSLVEFLYEQTGRDLENLNRISWEDAENRYSEMKLGLLKPSKRVSSKRLIEKYDFEFEYPSVYEGLTELMEVEG